MSFLQFANPIAWWAALVAVPVVLLYVLKTRMRRQPVATLLFWDQVFDENRPRAWWQQLRRIVSLLLQLAFVALLVLALVDPLWSWQQQRQRRVVLVMDNSASMQAIEQEDQTRLMLAKAAARALIRSLRGADQMAVLTASGAPRVAIGMTDHQNSLLEVVDELPSTDGTTSVPLAIELAERLLSDLEGEHEVIVLTDGCFSTAVTYEEPLNSAIADSSTDDGASGGTASIVKLYRVGSPRDNLGITRYQVRRSLLDAVGYQVLVDVTNASDEPAACRLELNLDDELVDVVPLELQPDQTLTRVLDHTSATGGQLVATLDAGDALAVDNRAVALLPRRDPIPVTLVTKGNLFLEQALRSIQLVDLQVAAEAPPVTPVGGVLVLDRVTPAELPVGRVLVIDPQSDTDMWRVEDAIDEPVVAEVDADSPLTQHVRLTNVLFPEAKRLSLTGSAEAVIKDPLDNPLLARIPRPSGDTVVLTCSLEKGDLPLRIAFPVLVKNAIEWFQGTSGDLRPATPSGQMATLDLTPLKQVASVTASAVVAEPTPDTGVEEDIAVVEASQAELTQDFLLESPAGDSTPIASADDQATLGPLQQVGVWRLCRPGQGGVSESSIGEQHAESMDAAADEPSILVACNLANTDESDLRPRAGGADIADLELLALGGHSLWFYLTLCGVGLVTAEWWLYQRRIVE